MSEYIGGLPRKRKLQNHHWFNRNEETDGSKLRISWKTLDFLKTDAVGVLTLTPMSIFPINSKQIYNI